MIAVVTKRKFLTMAVMMFVLLFMFQFTQVVKEVGNEYDVNEYITADGPDKKDAWQAENDGKSPLGQEEEYAVLIGTKESPIGAMANQWCTYTKRNLFVCESIGECSAKLIQKADVVLLQEDYIEYETQLSMLTVRAEAGANLVFCSLPEPEIIAEYPKLRQLLGIEEVRMNSVRLTGMDLFSGFLLGGETIYQPKDDKEKQERQDMDESVPWYCTGEGTKTYMVGLLEDKTVENEQLPAILWRNAVGEGNVFAVNGSYMSDSTGLGILDAMMAECNTYAVYPVVNAQNLAVANFPALATENADTMNRLYSRDMDAATRDIFLPGLYSMVEKGGFRLTCYLTPQFDYTDDNEPRTDSFIFYLKQLKEQSAEAGLSMQYVKANALLEKLEKDALFFEKADSAYCYGAAYLPTVETEVVDMWKTIPGYDTIDTVVCDRKDSQVLSYVDESVTCQSVTSNGVSHTYLDDLRMKSLQTALGYSNIVLDMNRIFWPKTEKDRWEMISEKFSGNINTYWKPFQMLEKTTVSESDDKVRAFLAMDYEDSRKGDDIRIKVEKKSNEVWMILRTHGEEIEKMEGGQYVEIEEDAYLLCIRDASCRIELCSKDSLAYPLP